MGLGVGLQGWTGPDTARRRWRSSSVVHARRRAFQLWPRPRSRLGLAVSGPSRERHALGQRAWRNGSSPSERTAPRSVQDAGPPRPKARRPSHHQCPEVGDGSRRPKERPFPLLTLVQDRQEGLVSHHLREPQSDRGEGSTVFSLQRDHVEARRLGEGGEPLRLHQHRRREPVGLAASLPLRREAGTQEAESLVDDLIGLVQHRVLVSALALSLEVVS